MTPASSWRFIGAPHVIQKIRIVPEDIVKTPEAGPVDGTERAGQRGPYAAKHPFRWRR